MSQWPTYLGIGGHKCASTWLSECLRYHPEVFISSPKEVHFFDHAEEIAKGIDMYLRHFEGAGCYKAVGEFTPSYLVNAVSVRYIRSILGRLKIVVSLRNPVERFLSHYAHLLRDGKLPRPSSNRLDEHALSEALNRAPGLVSNGTYFEPLSVWLAEFGADNVHVIRKEDIDIKPAAVLGELYSFLGVDPTYEPPMLVQRVSPGILPKYRCLESARRYLHRLAASHAPGIINQVKLLGISEAYRRLNAVPKEEGLVVAPQIYEFLWHRFADDVARTERLLDRRLWQAPERQSFG
jgi:hypothetical protein